MPVNKYMVLRGDEFENPRVVWRKARFLEIYYTQAAIGFYKNTWQSFDVDNLRYVVEVRLMPPVGKFAIPNLAPPT